MTREEALIIAGLLFSSALCLVVSTQAVVLILNGNPTGCLYGAASVGVALVTARIERAIR